MMALVIGLSSHLFADPTPSPVVQTAGATWDISLNSEGSGLWAISNPSTFSVDGAVLTVEQLTLDSDPNIFSFFGATNTLSIPQSYSLSVPLTVSLPAGQYFVSSSLAGSVTNGSSSSNNISLSPLSGSIMTSTVGALDAGVDLLNTPLTFSGVAPYTSQPFGAYTANNVLTLTAPVTTIDVLTSFSLSGNSSASLTFDFNVTPTPEPSTYALLIMGSCILFLAVRRLRIR